MKIILSKDLIDQIVILVGQLGGNDSSVYLGQSIIIIDSLDPLLNTIMIQTGSLEGIEKDIVSSCIKIHYKVLSNLFKLVGDQGKSITLELKGLILVAYSGQRTIETSNFFILENFPNVRDIIYQEINEYETIDVESEYVKLHNKNLVLNKTLKDINGIFIYNGQMYSTNLSSLFVTPTKSKLNLLLNKYLGSLIVQLKAKNIKCYSTAKNAFCVKMQINNCNCIIVLSLNDFKMNKKMLSMFDSQLDKIKNPIYKFSVSVIDFINELDIKFLKSISKEKVNIEIKEKKAILTSEIQDSSVNTKFHVTAKFDIYSDSEINVKFSMHLADLVKLLEYASMYSNIEFYITEGKTMITRFGENIFVFSIDKK